jgi:4-methyl-5(b-hydroxyethyl)-thiazole monophosphate biosynthesis
MPKTALIPIADGCEEIEAITVIDVLRRAGVEVSVAAVNQDQSLSISGAHSIQINADCTIDSCVNSAWDLIAVPGGIPGAEHLANCHQLEALLCSQVRDGKLYAAICAAPALVLGSKGLLEDRTATGHPMFQQNLNAKELNSESKVVVDGNCITSQGPGTALDFALELVEQLCGVVKREEVGAPMVLTTSATAYY